MPNGPHLVISTEYYEGHMEVRMEKGPGPGTSDPAIVAAHLHMLAEHVRTKGLDGLYNRGDSLTLKGTTSDA